MDMILIKILAAFLALSQVTTRPDAIKTEFDPARDVAEVTQVLRNGCGHFRKALDVESIDIDDLIKTAMDDPNAFTAEIKSLHGLKIESMVQIYRQFCKNENVKDSPVDLGEVIRFYDQAMADLPDQARLKGMRGAGAGGVLDNGLPICPRATVASGCRSRPSRFTSRRPSSPPRTNASTSIRASTSAA